MKSTVTFDNIPLTLTGRPLIPDTRAPGCTLTDCNWNEVTLGSLDGTPKLVTFFVSLDTPVCDLQIREFNRRAKELPEATASVIGISKDLPFAQKRFCETFDIRNMTLLSDYRTSSFGINYGVLIKEWNLLARGAIIIDERDVVRYVHIVDEISNQPDFDEVFGRLAEMAADSDGGSERESNRGREGDGRPVTADESDRRLAQLPGWELVEGRKIAKTLRFADFGEAKWFVEMLSSIAVEENHHPSLEWNFNCLQVTLTTHSAGGLTGKDFSLAGIINQLV